VKVLATPFDDDARPTRIEVDVERYAERPDIMGVYHRGRLLGITEADLHTTYPERFYEQVLAWMRDGQG
jgi:hypothetical protein